MNFGMISTRLAGVDGVSLETAKVATALEAMGHTCYYCAGEFDDNARPGLLVPEMHFTDRTAREIQHDAFFTSKPPPELYARTYASADYLRGEIEQFIDEYHIDVLVPQNASCIPMNIALGVAIADVVRRRHMLALFHHHDFYWERDRFINNDIQDILNYAFPPNLQTGVHMVISTVMQRRLAAFRGIDALYLPNVFDFDTPPPQPDDYANTFRAELGLSDEDLIVLQPTRIVRRKGIEKAVELVRKLDDPRLILLITGYEGDEPGEYGAWLREEAERAGIRYRFIGDYVDAQRGERDGHRVYNLWDVYPHAHFITYPSTYEGFGNALLETVYFRKPFVVHTYPVYLADIAPAGVRAVAFNHDITADVLAQTRNLIDDASLRDEMTGHNYAVCAQHFGYGKLRAVLELALERLATD